MLKMQKPKIILGRDELYPLSKDGHGRISKNITDIILSSKKLGLSINAIRAILVILSSLRSKQMHQKTQLSLFDSFTDITNDSNSTVSFTFLWKDFLPEGSKNYKKAEEGLVELASYSGKKEFKNEMGDPIRVYASIISDITVNDRQQGVRFNMNIVWYRLFLEITNYNKFSNRVIFEVPSVNALSWYFFLKTLPNKDNKGNPIDSHCFTLKNINEKFCSDYKYWGKIKEKILDPIKQTLDRTADISFNYKIVNEKVYIVIYNLDASVPMTFPSHENLKIANTIKYQRKKSKLSLDESLILESLYKKYTYALVYKATVRRSSLKDLTGMKYVEEVHRLIIEEQNKIAK